MLTRALCLTTAALVALPAAAKAPDYIGSVQAVGTAQGAETAKGTVFHDENRNSRLDEGEAGIEGVAVSNGREVVTTGADGRYALPVRDDMTLMITKPAGLATPVNARMIPQFSYIHKPDGTEDLRFGGIPSTGPLPEAVNFPLIPDDSDRADQNCLFFGDTQPYSERHLGYVREIAGDFLAARDNSETDCILLQGDIAGDDLSMYPRLQRILAQGNTPIWGAPGNHDLDFDAERDADSLDTFRANWGADHYSFDVGQVHFVILDDVNYPCTGQDFCDPEDPTYNGMLSEEQLTWLENDLSHVPEDKLIILNQHIPFQTFTDNQAQKHQLDNLEALMAVLGDRKVITMSGHTHTTENIAQGESFAGWEAHTGLAASPFERQHIIGAVSGSWYSGGLNDDGVPESYQRLGSPRGVFDVDFSGNSYTETYVPFAGGVDAQMHASVNLPRYREWLDEMLSYIELYGGTSDVMPPVVRGDLADPELVTRADLEGGSWFAVNVWNGGRDTEVSVSINNGAPIAATRTQEGDGEAKRVGVGYSDPYAILRETNDNRMAAKSAAGTSGYEMFQGTQYEGAAGPLPMWLMTRSSPHLWRADLPADLPAGVHEVEITATDRHGRTFTLAQTLEVVEALPSMTWDEAPWQ